MNDATAEKPTTPLKFCKDCVWYELPHDEGKDPICSHSQAKLSHTDLVSGEFKEWQAECRTMRKYIMPCGEEGKLFQEQ